MIATRPPTATLANPAPAAKPARDLSALGRVMVARAEAAARRHLAAVTEATRGARA